MSYEERLQVLGLETLVTRRKESDLVMAYQIENNPEMIDHKLFKKVSDSQNITRASKKANFNQPKCRTNVKMHSFASRVVKHWNSLPIDIQQAPSLKTFKTKLASV